LEKTENLFSGFRRNEKTGTQCRVFWLKPPKQAITSGASNPSLSAGIKCQKMQTTEIQHISVVFLFHQTHKKA